MNQPTNQPTKDQAGLWLTEISLHLPCLPSAGIKGKYYQPIKTLSLKKFLFFAKIIKLGARETAQILRTLAVLPEFNSQ